MNAPHHPSADTGSQPDDPRGIADFGLRIRGRRCADRSPSKDPLLEKPASFLQIRNPKSAIGNAHNLHSPLRGPSVESGDRFMNQTLSFGRTLGLLLILDAALLLSVLGRAPLSRIDEGQIAE